MFIGNNQSIKTRYEKGLHTIQFQSGIYDLTITKRDGSKKWEVVKGRVIEDQPRNSISPHSKPSISNNNNNNNNSIDKQWDDAGSFITSILNPGRIVKYLVAETSKLIHGPASITVINFRHSCCYGVTIEGESVGGVGVERCISLYSDSDTGHDYCKQCQCGKWRKARLNPQSGDDWTTSKLAYPALKCPRGRF